MMHTGCLLCKASKAWVCVSTCSAEQKVQEEELGSGEVHLEVGQVA
jgi:hypothetical protein